MIFADLEPIDHEYDCIKVVWYLICHWNNRNYGHFTKKWFHWKLALLVIAPPPLSLLILTLCSNFPVSGSKLFMNYFFQYYYCYNQKRLFGYYGIGFRLSAYRDSPLRYKDVCSFFFFQICPNWYSIVWGLQKRQKKSLFSTSVCSLHKTIHTHKFIHMHIYKTHIYINTFTPTHTHAYTYIW